MKRSYLALALLCSVHAVHHALAMTLNSPLIDTIDGNFKLDRLMQFSKRVDAFIDHNYGKDTVITLDDLIQHISQDPTADQSKIDRFLKTCINDFVRVMRDEGYFKDFQILYPVFQELLEAWARQRNKYNSPFYKFGKTMKDPHTEHATLTSLITSLAVYRTCLLDCREFLRDVVASLPKSYIAYEQGSIGHGARN